MDCYRLKVIMFSVVAPTTLKNEAANSAEFSVTITNQPGVI